MLVAGTRGYAFTADGTFSGLLASSTWPTTFGGPKGKRILGDVDLGEFALAGEAAA